MNAAPLIEIISRGVWQSTWAATMLVVLVLLVQWGFRKWLTQAWHYNLWLLVVARLAVPVWPSSPWSLFNLTLQPAKVPRMVQGEPRAASRTYASVQSKEFTALGAAETARSRFMPVDQEASQPATPVSASRVHQPASIRPPTLEKLAIIGQWLWGGVALVFGGRLLWDYGRMRRKLGKGRAVQDETILQGWAEAKVLMRTQPRVDLIETDLVKSPALFGLLRIRLLIPVGLAESFSARELRYVFMHELAHLKRGDLFLNWLMTGLLVLHWFNPVIWYALGRMRADRELACDALALAHAGEEEHKPYGRTVIKLLEGLVRPVTLPGLVGILENNQQMERRIQMIARFKKTNGWPFLAILAFGSVALIALTDAQSKSITTKALAKLEAAPGKTMDTPATSETAANKTPAGSDIGDMADANTGLTYTVARKFTGSNDVITVFDNLVLSPNGKFLNWQGTVVPVDGSKPFPLTDHRVWRESWAPNGRQIACCGVDGLYVVPVDAETGHATGPAKKLFSERVNLWGNQRLDWTPDSERIVFAAWDQAFSRPIAKAVSVRDGTVSEAPDWAELGLRSPDGRTLAYSPRGDGIWVRPAAGGQAKNLSGIAQFGRCEPLAWSADGQWIIGHAGPGEAGDEMRLFHFPDFREFKIPVPESVGSYVGKSPDADQLFFYRVSCDLAFVPKVMSIQGGPSVFLTPRQSGLSIMGGAKTSVTTGWADAMPLGYHWLPDGRSLVVTTVKTESGTRGLWLFSFTGEEPIELKIELPGLDQQDDGLWAPNGDKLLLTAIEAGANPACYLVPVSLREGRSSGPPVKLCGGSAQGAAWSPDGTLLAIIRDNDLWTFSGATSNWTQLTKTAVPKRNTAWSPDGTLLAYTMDDPNQTELWTVPAAGGAAKSILRSPRRPVNHWTWSPDSKSITLLDNGIILRRSLEGNTEWPLVRLKNLGFAGLSWLAWSPDGRKLAFRATDSLTEQETLFIWETGGGTPQRVDSQALGADPYAFTWSSDSQHIAYTCMERPKTRLAGTLSRLDVGDAVKLAARRVIPATTSTNRVAYVTNSSTNAVPITDSRFTDNFDTGALASWGFWEDPRKDLPHEHAVKNGELVLENSRAILGEVDWTNYVARVRIRLESAPAAGEAVAGFCVRRTPDNPDNPGSRSFYQLVIVCSGGKPTSVYLGILYHDQAGGTQQGRFDLRTPTMSLHQWYTLELEVKGRQLRGYLDGQLVAEGVDDRLMSGGIHLNSWNTRVRFDDFSVTLLP